VAGGSLSLALSEKWLVVPIAGNYFYDKSYNNKLVFGIHAGVSVEMKKGYRFSLMAEQALTPVHKNNSLTNNNQYYWRYWSAQFSLPLRLLHKPNN
jgi:hypothetical protein